MLSPYDYWVIGFYFAFMLLVGWVCRRFIANTSDYFRGGGRILWWMVGSSAFMLSFSAWTFTGGASKAYRDGVVILTIYLGNALSFLWNYLLFAPRFRQMRVVTAMQAVRLRFGAANEQFFTWLQIPLGILYAGIWLAGLSVFTSAVFDVSLDWTIALTGIVVLIVAVVGGSWAVVAGDFIQMLILMPVTIVAAFLALAKVGGLAAFFAKVPRDHLALTGTELSPILWLWIIAVLLKQSFAMNSMLESSRYLSVKDSSHARRAALLGMVLHLVGPFVWFIPPLVATITHPDLHALFPRLRNPDEGAYVATCFDVMPAGMIGLLISGIFAATMSAMDGGLNRNAGFFVKSFYQVVVRPRASETELLLISKITTCLFGLLVILSASLLTTRLSTTGLFNQMLDLSALVALPYAMPLVWGILIKRAPSWAGWTTVLAGFASSVVAYCCLNATWIQTAAGWGPLTRRERDDWLLLSSVLLNVTVCSAWFLGSCLFARRRSADEQARVDGFFKQMATPVDFAREVGDDDDARQHLTMGALALVYGSFITLMLLIPNPEAGRLGILFCAICMLGAGGLLRWRGHRLASIAPAVHEAGVTSTPQATTKSPVERR
jgi:SSS family solute:Na+ symporter